VIVADRDNCVLYEMFNAFPGSGLRWDDDDLHSLETVTGSAFEVVQTGGVTTG
jgi:hypothetical protein